MAEYMKSEPDDDFHLTIELLLLFVIPGLITLSAIKIPRELVAPATDASPLGYTRSLSFFLVPVVIIILSLLRRPHIRLHWDAIAICVAATASLGFFLDLCFGPLFFSFPNTAAIIGWKFGALDLTTLRWLPNYLPVEEFVFYVLGVACSLFLYIWGNEVWYRAYNVEEYELKVKALGKVTSWQIRPAIIGAGLIFFAFCYKKLGPHSAHTGFPGYFAFMVVSIFLPACAFYKNTKRLINWRSLALTMLVQSFMSLALEVTLGLPYQWWAYKREQMMGVFIGGWGDLPIECILMWIATGYYTVFVYESVRLFLTRRSMLRERAKEKSDL